MSRVITILITHIRGLITPLMTTHEPPGTEPCKTLENRKQNSRGPSKHREPDNKTLIVRLMDKILHDPKDPKLWELWYIPYYGSCRILSINRRKDTPEAWSNCKTLHFKVQA